MKLEVKTGEARSPSRASIDVTSVLNLSVCFIYTFHTSQLYLNCFEFY